MQVSTGIGYLPYSQLNLPIMGLAVVEVGNNRYFGFSQNIGSVRSTNFSNLAWVGKELMIQASGDVALRSYLGQIRIPKYKDTLDALIATHIANMNNIENMELLPVPAWFAGVQNNAFMLIKYILLFMSIIYPPDKAIDRVTTQLYSWKPLSSSNSLTITRFRSFVIF